MRAEILYRLVLSLILLVFAIGLATLYLVSDLGPTLSAVSIMGFLGLLASSLNQFLALRDEQKKTNAETLPGTEYKRESMENLL